VLLFDERDAARAADFAGTLARFDAVVRFDDGLLADVTGRSVGTAVDLRTPADVRRAEALAVVGSGGGGLSPKSDKDDDDPSDPSSSSSPSSSPEQQSVVLADARDWAIIPAENLVAAFQEARRRSAASYDAAVRKSTQEEEEEEEGGRRKLPRRPRPTPKLLVTSATADGALALLGALESGVDGVVLRTGDPGEVRALCAAVGEAAAARASAFVEEKRSSENNTNDDNDGEIQFEVGVVSSVSPAGMGDRVCVDVTVLLEPGEGLLVGSFAAAALLVHSEREGAQGGGGEGGGGGKSETNNEAYISPRPFRVNAGAVHSYVAVPRSRTAYLSELEAGSEVLVVRPPMSWNNDDDGGGGGGESLTTTSTTTSTTAVVGRAKVERRPMTKVEVRLADGSTCSAILQNAETVRVVAPRGGRGGGFAASSLPPPLLPPAPPSTAMTKPPRRLAREDEEALRWAMDPSSSASSSSSKSPPPEKLAEEDEKTLDWVMGPSESSNSYPSSHPLSPSSPALSATPTWSSTSSSSDDEEENENNDDDGNESDGAEELVEGPPRRPYLLPKNDSRAVAALRWLLGGGGGGGGKRGGKGGGDEEDGGARTRSSSSSFASPVFPSMKWDPRETKGWTTVAVTDLAPGQPVLVRRAAAARHTGIEIDESIVER